MIPPNILRVASMDIKRSWNTTNTKIPVHRTTRTTTNNTHGDPGQQTHPTVFTSVGW